MKPLISVQSEELLRGCYRIREWTRRTGDVGERGRKFWRGLKPESGIVPLNDYYTGVPFNVQ